MEQNRQVQSLTPAQQAITTFTSKINGNYVQKQLMQVLGQNAGTFSTSIIEVFTNDKALQACDVNKVVQEAMKAASLKLPINKNLGYAYLLVFKNWDKEARMSVQTPQMVIGYKGYIQLAMRTGQYENINADVVYEGELRGKDKLTGAIDLNGEKTSDRVVGYFAHFELINGFKKTLYMTVEQMASYALNYSPSFKVKEKPTVDTLVDIAIKQAKEGPEPGKLGWLGDFNSMAQKTVLKNLLSKFGYLSIEMMDAIAKDEQQEYDVAKEVRDEGNEESVQIISADKMIAIEDVKDEEEPPI